MTKLGQVSVGGKNDVRIMGILNVSPESFYKKSVVTKKNIANIVKQMDISGVDIIDIGGMSTAPYKSTLISEKIESKRIVDAIKIIQNVSNVPISIDTCRASVAKNALDFGIDIINDISGLKYDKNMVNVLEKFNPSVVLCAYSKNIVHGNHINQIKKLFRESITLARHAHISINNIVLDPAIGFFRKNATGSFFTKINFHWVLRDLLILQNLRSLDIGFPILVSPSNKSFIGNILDRKNPSDRLSGSLAAEVFSVINGASVIRTHNVKETKNVVCLAKKIFSKIKKRL